MNGLLTNQVNYLDVRDLRQGSYLLKIKNQTVMLQLVK